MPKSIFTLLIFFASSICSAEQIETSIISTIDSTTSKSLVNPKPNDFLNHFGFFLGPMPLPFWNGNAQLSTEYLITPWLSLWGSYKREMRDSDGPFNLSINLGENLKSETKNYYTALRLYNPLSNNWLRGFYMTAGYKWSDIYVTASPGIFKGLTANSQSNDQGGYGGLGYRFAIQQRNNWVLNFDVALNYEPGFIDDVVYSANGTQLFGGNSKGQAQVTYRTRNRIYPEFNVGLRF